MITGHLFKRLKRLRAPDDLNEHTRHVYLGRVCDQIIKQFRRMSHLTAVVVPLDAENIEGCGESAGSRAHPECADFADTEYCRESWQLHLAELSLQPETHWHRCDFGKRCAIVPLLCDDRCLALFRLACPDSVPEHAFESSVELLDVLVRNAATTEAATLRQLFPSGRSSPDPASPAPPADGKRPSQSPLHPQVIKAIEYVEHALSDPNVTVRHVAETLEIHPDYLANLFRKEVGQRMSRYISSRRIERAKNLLVTTDWRIKRIAHESGFANSKWFYHVFQSSTGLTPTSYRRQARQREAQEVRNS